MSNFSAKASLLSTILLFAVAPALAADAPAPQRPPCSREATILSPHKNDGTLDDMRCYVAYVNQEFNRTNNELRTLLLATQSSLQMMTFDRDQALAGQAALDKELTELKAKAVSVTPAAPVTPVTPDFHP